MEADPNGEGLTKEPLRTILSDPLRVTILGLLQKGPLSAAEVAAKLEVSADRVRSHFRRLLAVGAIADAGEEARRGVVQHYYTSDEPAIVDGADNAALNISQLRAFHSGVLRLSFSEAASALLGKPRQRPDAVVVRVPLALDEDGWRELAAIHREAVDQVLELKARIAERPVAAGDTIRAISVLLCFEEP